MCGSTMVTNLRPFDTKFSIIDFGSENLLGSQVKYLEKSFFLTKNEKFFEKDFSSLLFAVRMFDIEP